MKNEPLDIDNDFDKTSGKGKERMVMMELYLFQHVNQIWKGNSRMITIKQRLRCLKWFIKPCFIIQFNIERFVQRIYNWGMWLI